MSDIKLPEIPASYVPHPATLKAALKASTQKILFRKTDGSLREMLGTLVPELLPPTPPLAEGEAPKVRKTPEGNISFWSIEDLAWRSFKIENLLSMEPVDYKPE